MKYIYFHDVQTVEELKRQYKTLAFKYHPDREGGSKEIMQQVNAEYDELLARVRNAEYDELLARVRNVHESADGKTYTREAAADVPDDFRKVIDAIINFDCRIELCGSWLWVFGGFQYRQQLKELGFFFCSRKKAWAWTQEPTNNKHKLTLDEIRRLHGSEIIKDGETKRTLKSGYAMAVAVV